jgi:hypothetical protein
MKRYISNQGGGRHAPADLSALAPSQLPYCAAHRASTGPQLRHNLKSIMRLAPAGVLLRRRSQCTPLPWPPCSLRPHTQSNMNCTPSRWCGLSQHVSMGSTSIALPASASPPPAAAAIAAETSVSAAGAAAATVSEGSQRIKGSIPEGSASGGGCASCCGGCAAKAPGCCCGAGRAGCTKGFEAPQGTKCLRANNRLRRAWECSTRGGHSTCKVCALL